MTKRRLIDITPPQKASKKQKEAEKGPRRRAFSLALPFPIPLGIAVFILVISIFVAAHILLAKAEIVIFPHTRDLSLNSSATVQEKRNVVDLQKRIIPGKFFAKEKSLLKVYPASGKNIEETKAEGIVRVFNNQSKPQVLIATTRFMSEQGKVFRSKERATIPAGGYQDVRVSAAAAGEEYNIGPSSFSVPGLAGSPVYTAVYGKSYENMGGGGRKEQPFVTLEDIESATKSLEQDLKRAAREELKNEVTDSYAIDEKWFHEKVLSLSSQVKEGAELAHFTVQGKIQVAVLAISQQGIQEFATLFLSQQLGQEERMVPGSVEVVYGAQNFDLAGRTMELSLSAWGKAYEDIDETALKAQIGGKRKQETEILLSSTPAIASFQLKLFPFWIRSLPRSLEKIHFTIAFP